MSLLWLRRGSPARAALGQFSRPLEDTYLSADTAGMAKKPEPPKPIRWNVYKFASKAVWLGEVEAPDEAAAMEKATAEYKIPANRLMALRAMTLRGGQIKRAQLREWWPHHVVQVTKSSLRRPWLTPRAPTFLPEFLDCLN
jgi:hypothetical protein